MRSRRSLLAHVLFGKPGSHFSGTCDLVGACPLRKTGSHLSGTCASWPAAHVPFDQAAHLAFGIAAGHHALDELAVLLLAVAVLLPPKAASTRTTAAANGDAVRRRRPARPRGRRAGAAEPTSAEQSVDAVVPVHAALLRIRTFCEAGCCGSASIGRPADSMWRMSPSRSRFSSVRTCWRDSPSRRAASSWRRSARSAARGRHAARVPARSDNRAPP